jgi:D-alanine-D-alanine ligase
MRVALLYNARPAENDPALPDDMFEEYDSDSTIRSIADALRKIDMDVEPVLADAELPWRLTQRKFDFAFNIAEGKGRRCREAVPAAICELLGLPCTGSDSVTLGITLDKWIAKRVVSHDVPVARGVLIEREEDETGLITLRHPLIVKPNDEGSSKGIRGNPVFSELNETVERCRWLRTQYHCPVLVEEFLSGPEVTVALTGNQPSPRVLGMMEIAPASVGERFVYSIEVKRGWRNKVRYHMPPRLDQRTLNSIRDYALASYRLLGCRDIARMDFRLDGKGTPHFIECNPLPGLDAANSDIVILSRNIMPYEKLVQGILLDAIRRVGDAKNEGAHPAHHTA